MSTAFSSASIHWLLDPDAPVLQIDETTDVLRHRIPMPAEVGHGWIESYHLALGMNLSHGCHHFTAEMAGQQVTLFTSTTEFLENILCIQSAQRGRVLLHEQRAGVEVLFGHGHDLFLHVDHLEMAPCLDASTVVEVTMLEIGDSVLYRLLGEASGQALLARLGVAAVPSARVRPVPPAIAALLHAGLTSSLCGAARKLFAQAKVLEYLCGLAQHITVDLRETVPLLRRREQVHRLHEDLTRLEGKSPTLDELSRRYGLSARTLNNDFKHAFGHSIVGFITAHRLAQAHTLLLDSEIAMKQLADRLGYSHVNHFINAFRRQYGYPPGQLRRH
ncbi:MAG: AraC family transcriptional regulator [Candidatus Contendobacter sp.]|nr:AraC family transcriptional regulator [Candidatus Contendobacter sp.]